MMGISEKPVFLCFASKSTKDRFHRYYLCFQPSNLHGLDKNLDVNLHGLDKNLGVNLHGLDNNMDE